MATLSASQIRLLLSTVQARATPYSGGVKVAVDYLAHPPSGTAAGSLDLAWSATYTIGTSATQALDFTALASGPAGETVDMVKVDWVVIQGVTANTAALHVKANAANGLVAFLADASDILIVAAAAGDRPYIIPCGGYATSASLKALDLVNTSGAVTWTGTVTVLGRSA